MTFQTILAEIDAQMDSLQQARNLIAASQGIGLATSGTSTSQPIASSLRRVQAAQTSRAVLESLSSLAPNGAGHISTPVKATGPSRISQRPGMSEEAKKRIGEATKKRWADKRQAVIDKEAAKAMKKMVAQAAKAANPKQATA